MTSELAKLLDGEVAARFGRARGNNDAELHLRGGLWCSDIHPPKHAEGCCERDSWGFNHERIHIEDATASALWLAHLLAVCVEKNWQVKFDLFPQKIVLVVPHDGGSLVMMENGEHMTALARAMLAVPEENP